MKIPQANKIETIFNEHGIKRLDYYYWLNQRDDQDIIDYLNLENEYTQFVLENTKDLQNQLFEEMKGRIKDEDNSVPFLYKSYMYMTKFVQNSEYPIYSRKAINSDIEELLLNVNDLAKGLDYCHVASYEVSPDDKYLLYTLDKVGRRQYELLIMNLDTKEIYTIKHTETNGSALWSSCGRYIYFVENDQETLRSCKVFKLNFADYSKELIYQEIDEAFTLSIAKSKCESEILIISDSTTTSEVLQIDAYASYPVVKPILARQKNIEYAIDKLNGNYYAKINDKGENFRLVQLNGNSVENCKEIFAHNSNVLLEGFELFDKFIAIEKRVNGLIELEIIDYEGILLHKIEFDDNCYDASLSINLMPDLNTVRYTYSSLNTPASVFEYDTSTCQSKLLKRQEIPSGHNPEDYATERLFVQSRDGVNIPVSLVYKKSLYTKGTNPILLYGYGSYGISIDAGFSSNRFSLIDRGFVFALAHIRGGEELGRKWYLGGKMMNKKNTFYDFIDVTRALADLGYCDRTKISAMGGSAGGLLMGAIANIEPQLYNSVVAAVPFVDVVTTMMDSSIPLTTGEYEEWGNPNEKEYYEYMLSYSPYDNIAPQNYPAILATTGYHDSQVQYWEPAKWVAKLRDYNLSDKPILLYTDMSSGHGGASGRYQYLNDIALEYAFLLKYGM